MIGRCANLGFRGDAVEVFVLVGDNGRLCDWSVECPDRNHWTVFPWRRDFCMFFFRNVGHQSPSDAASHPRRTEGSSKNERMGERSGMH